jgi:RecB family exonuclease
MPVYLITGEVGSGKTEKVLEHLSGHIKKRSGLCVTPSEASAFGLRQRLLFKNDSLLGDTVLPYNLFIKKLSGAIKPLISQNEQVLLLYRLLEEARLNYFKSASLGTARQAAKTITALKSNFIRPPLLKKILAKNPGRREEDLTALFELYEREKERIGLLDDGDLPVIAARNIEAKKENVLKNLKCIAFDEFSRFTPGQVKIAGLIGKLYPDIETLISLPSVQDEKELFYPYIQRSRAAFEKISFEEIKMPVRANEKRAALENCLLRSPDQEIRYIAGEIIKIIGQGTKPGKAAVFTRQNDPWIMDFLREIENCGLASLPNNSGAAMSSPILHELFSKMPDILPASANAGEFSETMKGEIKNLCVKISNDLAGGRLHARNVISSYSLNGILDSLSYAAHVLKLKKMTREMFLNLVLSDCMSFFVSAGSLAGASPVRIETFEDGPSSHADVVFIPRAAEGIIPAPFSDRLFFSHENAFGSGVLSEIFPDPDDSLAKESFLFHRILRKAAKKIIITRSAIDEDGKETAASSFLDTMEEPRPVEIPAAGFKKMTPSFAKHLERVIEIERERELGIIGHPAYHGCLQDKGVRETIKKKFTEEPLSPSHIETYAECPFRFFVERVLNLAPSEEITPEIQPRDLGSLIHLVLERFYKLNIGLFKKAADNKILEKELEKSAERLVNEVFSEKEAKISYSAKGLRPHAKKTVEKMTKQVIRSELHMVRALPSPLLPIECEWEFGKTPQTALKLEIEGSSPALIRGRVDRIDATPDNSCFAVVDYKTGKNIGPVIGKMKKGLHVQLPLYVEAVKKFKLPQSTPLGGVILSVYKGEKKHGFLKKSFNDIHYALSSRLHSVQDDDKWEEILRDALAAAARHILAIRKSNFEVRPAECRSFCPYEDICRYNKKGSDDIPAAGS